MKQKKGFLAANPPDVFGVNRDTNIPCLQLNILLDLICCGPIFFAGGPGHLVQIHGNMDYSKYQQIKNLNLTALAIL